MFDRVVKWVKAGKKVKIFTARVHSGNPEVVNHIEQWMAKHFGFVLEITNVKDFAMIELWDDRCVQVEINTGIPVASCKNRKRKPSHD